MGFGGHLMRDGLCYFPVKEFNQFLLQEASIQDNTDLSSWGLAFEWSQSTFFLR